MKQNKYGYVKLSHRDSKAFELIKMAFEKDKLRQEKIIKNELIKSLKELVDKYKK